MKLKNKKIINLITTFSIITPSLILATSGGGKSLSTPTLQQAKISKKISLNSNKWLKNLTNNINIETTFDNLKNETLVSEGIDASLVTDSSKGIYKEIYNTIKTKFNKKVISNLNKKINDETIKEYEKQKLISLRDNYQIIQNKLILYFKSATKIRPGFSNDIKLSIKLKPDSLFLDSSKIDCGSFNLTTKFTKDQENIAINYWVIKRIKLLQIQINISNLFIKNYVSQIKEQIIIRDKFTKIDPIYQTLFKTKYNIYSNDKQTFSLTEIKEYKIEIKQNDSNLSFSFPLKINAIAKIKIQVMDNKKNAYKGTWNSQTNKLKFLNLKNTDTITKDLFTNENNLTSLTIRKGKLPITPFGEEDSLFGQYGLKRLTNLTLTNSTWTSIPYRCFASIKNVVNLDLSGCLKLESIEKHAFYEADKLINLNLSNTSIKTLGEQIKEYPFGKDNKIENLNLENCSKLTTINYWSFFNSKNLKTINFKGCTSLKTIGEYAFEYSKLSTLDLRTCSSLEKIEKSAFSYCSTLTSLDLSNCSSLTSIGDSAFENARLTSLDLSGCINLTSIGDSAFKNAKLTTFKTSNLINLKTIGSSAFPNSRLNLKFLEELPALETIGWYAFTNSHWTGRLNLSKCTNLKDLKPISLGNGKQVTGYMSVKILNKWKTWNWTQIFYNGFIHTIFKIDETYSWVRSW